MSILDRIALRLGYQRKGWPGVPRRLIGRYTCPNGEHNFGLVVPAQLEEQDRFTCPHGVYSFRDLVLEPEEEQ
jgi:hypothetical protein